MFSRNRFLVPVVVATMLSSSITFSQSAFAVGEDWFVADGPSVTCDDAGTALDPFHSVQCAIDAATSGDTIRVAAGDYAGFTVNKPLTILGPNDGIAPGPGITRAAEAVIESPVSITSAIDGATISGFNLSSSNSEDVGLSIGSNSRNISISHNEISGFDQGIRSQGNSSSFGSYMDVSHNYIHGLSLAASGSYSIHLRNVKNLTVSGNFITDSVTDPVLTGSQLRRGILLRGAQDAVVSNNTVDFGSAASRRATFAIDIQQLLNDGVNGNDIPVSNVQITGNTLSGATTGINFLDLGAQATNVLIERNTAQNVFTGVTFRSYGQTGTTVVQELLVQRNDFSDIDSASGVLSAGVQVYSIDISAPVVGEFDGVVVQGNKLPSNTINQLPEINGLNVGAINPLAAGFPSVISFHATDITDLDARANYWGGEIPTTDNSRQANVAGSILAFTDDSSQAGQPGFWPSCSGLQVASATALDVQELAECAPSTPGTPTATAGNGRATISWTEPSSGTSPFTYTVESSPEGATCAVSGLTALCTGLSYLSSYTFTVTASNAFGSAVSGESVAVEAAEQDWFVDQGTDVACNDLGTEADPFQSVQCAIDAAASGDTIRVSAGDYSGFAVDKSLTILGPNDGVAPGPGITREPEAVIESAVSISSSVDGVTLSGFSLAPTSAAGVGISVGSSTQNVSITYNDISGFDQGIRSQGNSSSFGSFMDISYNYVHALTLGSSGSYSIHLRNVKNLTVSENIITDSVTDPVLTGSQLRRGILLRGAQDAVVSNNTVDFGSVASTKSYYAISIAQLLNDGVNGNDIPVTNVEIIGNTLSGAVNGINFLDLGARATNVVIDGNTARNVFVGVSFKSYGQTGASVVNELLVQRNDFSDIDSASGVISAGVQVYSIDITPPAASEFEGVVVQGNKLPSNKINQLSEINGLMVGAINPFAPGFPNVLTFYSQNITDLDARGNFWGGEVPTTDITRQANVAGSILTGSYSDDPSKVGQPGFWPLSNDADLSGLSLSTGTLSPEFAAATTSYTVRVPASVTSVAFTPTKSGIDASMDLYLGASGTTPFTGALGQRETVIRVVVTAEDGTEKTYRVTVSRINLTRQNITFTPVASVTATTPVYALTASADSGLNVAFSSTTEDICTVSGTTLSPVKAGTCVITATQPGNDTYAPASVNKSIMITRVAQTITLFNPANMTTLSGPQTLSASKGPGTAPVTFSTNSSGVCSITGTALTVLAAGACVITASQAEDGKYASTSAIKTVTVSKAAQTITLFNPANMTTVSGPQTLSALKGLGTAPVTFSTNSSSVCSITGTSLTVVAAGACVIRASQAEDDRYAAASNVTKTITISKAAQTIIFTPIVSLSATTPSYTLTAAAGVGLTVSFASTTPLVCTVNGTTLTPVKPGKCSITASQSGNGTYLAATNVSKSITIDFASQATLTVSNSTSFAFAKGSPVTLTAAGGSGVGNAVTFSVRGTGCSISSGALSVARTTRPGSLVSCSVTATRAGNAIYLPTTSVAKSFFFQNR